MFAAVLLEFENVLASTGDIRRGALRRSLADEGVPLSDALHEECAAGLPPRGAAAAIAHRFGAALDATALDLVALRAERYFAEQIGKGVVLAPGAREFVEGAHGRVPLAVVTRACRREVEFVLGLAGLAAAFECVIASDDVAQPKPSAEAHQAAVAKLARRRPVAPAQVIALEDALPGIRAAQRAGMRCVAVGAVPAYHAAAADAYVDSLAGHTLDSLSRLVSHGQDRVTHA